MLFNLINNESAADKVILMMQVDEVLPCVQLGGTEEMKISKEKKNKKGKSKKEKIKKQV